MKLKEGEVRNDDDDGGEENETRTLITNQAQKITSHSNYERIPF